MAEYYLYILNCADNTLYTGITTDLKRRLLEHNGKLKGGAKYTAARQPLKMIYQKNFTGRSAALIEEARIKKLKREDKLKLIKKSNKSKIIK